MKPLRPKSINIKNKLHCVEKVSILFCTRIWKQNVEIRTRTRVSTAKRCQIQRNNRYYHLYLTVLKMLIFDASIATNIQKVVLFKSHRVFFSQFYFACKLCSKKKHLVFLILILFDKLQKEIHDSMFSIWRIHLSSITGLILPRRKLLEI